MGRTTWVTLALIASNLVILGTTNVQAQPGPDSLWRERRRVLAAKPVIRSIQVHGARVLPASAIRSRMHSKTSSALDFLPLVAARRLRRDSDLQDSVALHNWLQSLGYLQADVQVTYRFTDSLQTAARIDVYVNEGEQTVLDTAILDLTPVPVMPSAERHVRRLEPRAPYNPFLVRQVQFDLKTDYANAGYPYAEVTADTGSVSQTGRVRLVLRCEPGPHVRFGAVQLPELRWTKPHAVQREIAFREGDPYSRRLIVKSEENLYTSGLFDFVALEARPEQNGRDTLPVFAVRGIERKPVFINARTGGKQDLNHDLVWSTEIEAGDRNFTGSGRLIRASGLAEFIVITQWQELKYRFSTAYTEPWPLGLHLPVTLELAYEPGVQDALRPYRIQRWEGLLSVLKRWSRKTRAWLVFTYEQVDIFDLDPEIEEQFRADSGISVTRSITLAQRRDARNNPLSPTRGSVTSGEFEYAGDFLGGDNNFLRFEGSWSRYARISDSWNVIAHRGLFGYLEGTGPADRVPSQERYFLGGANTVRGFDENSIRRDGGEFMVVGNIELRRPLLGRLWMSLFADVGNLWDRVEDMRWAEWNVGMGAGLQFMSPVGPIRLDVGYPVAVARGVDAPRHEQYHLSIGYAY